MNSETTYTHTTPRSQYKVKLTQDAQSFQIELTEKFSICQWKGVFTAENIRDITSKTGQQIYFKQFAELLNRALSQRDIACYVDVLSSQDLKNMKARKQQSGGQGDNKPSKSNQRYLILTHMANQKKFHYPLSLSPVQLNLEVQDLKTIYNELRIELEAARTAALNDTAKSQNSISINYQKQKKGNIISNQSTKTKQFDQMKSQNQILKAKLQRLQEQAEKKKANIQIEAAIERIQTLKQSVETQNLEIVDWKNNIQDQQQNLVDLKKQMIKLHKKICSLLVTQKEILARKKGEEVQKQLNQMKNHLKKNTNELEKLKKELQSAKNKIRQLEIKAKKLNSEKEVIRRGRRGPYSSTGSVRSYGSYSSGARSYGGVSNSSKSRSNYSYNSYKYR